MVRNIGHIIRKKRNHELLKVVLLQSPQGIRREHLAKKSKLTKPTIDFHMKIFIKEGTVVKRGYLYFWKHNYEEILRDHAREKERLRRRNRIEDKIFGELIKKVLECKTVKEIDEFDSEKFTKERRAHYVEESV